MTAEVLVGLLKQSHCHDMIQHSSWGLPACNNTVNESSLLQFYVRVSRVVVNVRNRECYAGGSSSTAQIRILLNALHTSITLQVDRGRSMEIHMQI